MSVRLAAPQSSADWREARRLIEEYAASLGVDPVPGTAYLELDLRREP